ncbi:MAG: hypothetical protein JXA67_03570 [Micromonosporaceae bacterium]|nr:hypothetical protein [Micromonosporaceae bacterium]
MSDADHVRAALALIGQRDIVASLVAMHEQGTATAADLQTRGISQPSQVLRSLATRRLAEPATAGSQTEDSEGGSYQPTDRGRELIAILLDLKSWGTRYLTS